MFINDTQLFLVAPIVSDDRTANPSIAELSNEGEERLAIVFCAKILPDELLKSTDSGFNSIILLLIIDLASLTDIIIFFELIK